MPMVKSFTQAQWDAASRRLDDLPDKPAHEHRVNVQDAIKAMHAQIKGAQNKGYTLEEIVQQFARDGVEISASTLRYAMRRALEGGQPVQADKGRTIAATAKTNARPHARKPGQAGITRDKMPSRATGTAAVSAPIRGFLGFPISPDTEDL
ncbi:hypothetical protein [Burkholderia sp. BCC1985]|uniref:hypothetical protein n=1 Tax=Burkholderia sp. BCC1985 TaxID=2817442 RepID=UPI002AB2309E|nr:hypothetical protein [Burkholderia sp. BCC1985]